MTFKPSKLGERIARRLIRDHNIALVFDANQHGIWRDYDAAWENRGGMDYATWFLSDQFGFAHVRMWFFDGTFQSQVFEICSNQPASELASYKKCPIWVVTQNDKHRFISIMGGQPDEFLQESITRYEDSYHGKFSGVAQ